MITVQLNKGSQSGAITFAGDEVSEPCEMTASGDFSLADIQDFFWLISLTPDGPAQGIYELAGNVCAPVEVLRALQISYVDVTGIPQDWQEEMESLDQELDALFEDDCQS